jgi:esterase/lipase
LSVILAFLLSLFSKLRNTPYQKIKQYAQQRKTEAARQEKAQKTLKRIASQFTKTTGVKLTFENGAYRTEGDCEVTMLVNSARFDFLVTPKDAAEVYNAIKPFLQRIIPKL